MGGCLNYIYIYVLQLKGLGRCAVFIDVPWVRDSRRSPVSTGYSPPTGPCTSCSGISGALCFSGCPL